LIAHNEDSIAVQIRMIAHESNSALYAINSFLSILIEFLLLFFILVFLLINFLKITLVSITVFVFLFLIYYLLFDKKIKEVGTKRVLSENLFYQKIYSALSIFREIKFLKKENFFINNIIKIILDLKKIAIQDTLFNGIIRPAIEFFLIMIILGSLIYSKYYLNLPNQEIITTIGIFLAALIRCFPSITKLFMNYQKIVFRKKSVEIIDNQLEEINNNKDISDIIEKDKVYFLNKNIRFSNIYFSYKDRPVLLENINLEILKGETVGILGKNGSGKSTLLDILTGMTKPNSGEILIDGESINKNLDDWQSKIIYLSQKNYLFEEDILSNIILGESEKNINYDRLENALKISNFTNTKEEFPNGLNTQIGGNNFKISGGQQKKIQIARCFYQITNEKKLLILDEPTDNLDKESKIVFFNELQKYKNNKTVILISHNTDDLKICDKIYNLEKKS
jgi:ABC-type bacteriocin/lantibiotic exporter with double-glycine peptidase domain